MELGIVGLGKMGANMRERLVRRGHRVVGYDLRGGEVSSLEALVASLAAPRAVWTMVPHGAPTEETVRALAALLAPGDLVIDGGNSNYKESRRRAADLATKGVGFLDCGTSGGVWGLERGYCLMVGGEHEHVERVRPILEDLACEGGLAHVGQSGAGHFTKMVHNGVEYGMMQALGEGYELLRAAEQDLGIDVRASLEVWRHGSVVQSWLLDLLVRAIEEDPALSRVRGYANDSGEGRWTVQEAVERAVPLHVISAALFARFESRQDDSLAMKAIAALRQQFGGHAVEPSDS